LEVVIREAWDDLSGGWLAFVGGLGAVAVVADDVAAIVAVTVDGVAVAVGAVVAVAIVAVIAVVAVAVAVAIVMDRQGSSQATDLYEPCCFEYAVVAVVAAVAEAAVVLEEMSAAERAMAAEDANDKSIAEFAVTVIAISVAVLQYQEVKVRSVDSTSSSNPFAENQFAIQSVP
jgi:hypothetical protein